MGQVAAVNIGIQTDGHAFKLPRQRFRSKVLYFLKKNAAGEGARRHTRSVSFAYTTYMPPSAAAVRDSRRATQVTLKAVTLLAGVLATLFVITFFFSDRGMNDLQRARKRVDGLQSDIKRLQAENVRLRSEIESVKKSTYAVERIAREELGMSKKGEILYMLPKER